MAMEEAGCPEEQWVAEEDDLADKEGGSAAAAAVAATAGEASSPPAAPAPAAAAEPQVKGVVPRGGGEKVSAAEARARATEVAG